MPLIEQSSFPGAPRLQFNGHLQTLIPGIFRRTTGIAFSRERITTPDGDFLDLDWQRAAYDAPERKLAILTHGLEGSTQSSYILGMTKMLADNGWDVLAWNCRSCSGEMNRAFRMYHHGEIEDIGTVVQHAIQKKQWNTIGLMGFSMGANITMKYLGVHGEQIPKEVFGAVVFSAPCDLEAGANVLDKPENWIYKKKFLGALSTKIHLKNAAFPGKLDVSRLKAVKRWRDFDEWFAAPICGYRDAEDFYRNASAKYFIPGIRRRTLLVSALNDPILTPACFPVDIAQDHRYFHLERPEGGGHCGFMTPKDLVAWSERRALQWLEMLVEKG